MEMEALLADLSLDFQVNTPKLLIPNQLVKALPRNW